jgi:hypothetical protein
MTRRNKLLGTTAMPDLGVEAPKIEDDLNGARKPLEVIQGGAAPETGGVSAQKKASQPRQPKATVAEKATKATVTRKARAKPKPPGIPSEPPPKTYRSEPGDDVAPIKKPGGFSLDKFAVKKPVNRGVETLQGVLQVLRLADVNDFFRLHDDEEAYWSVPLCFVNVPILGVKKETLHLIDENLAIKHLPPKKIIRHRLALATKPGDILFLAQIPSTNLDNSWNVSTLQAAQQGKSFWTGLASLKEAGEERYEVTKARDFDAFEKPKWTGKSLTELIVATFLPGGRIIEVEEHPGLLRSLGAKLPLK